MGGEAGRGIQGVFGARHDGAGITSVSFSYFEEMLKEARGGGQRTGSLGAKRLAVLRMVGVPVWSSKEVRPGTFFCGRSIDKVRWRGRAKKIGRPAKTRVCVRQNSKYSYSYMLCARAVRHDTLAVG